MRHIAFTSDAAHAVARPRGLTASAHLFYLCSHAKLEPGGLDDRIERCRRTLDVLTGKGMQIVEALDADDDDAPITETALAFSRLSRAIRLNILLDLRLEDLARGGASALQAECDLARAAPDAPEAEATDAAEPRDSRIRIDRLDRESPDEALRWLKRPITDMVAAVCKGFGLSPEETAQARAPFAALSANDDGPDEPPARRAAGASPATPAAATPRPGSALKARLMAGSAGARALGP